MAMTNPTPQEEPRYDARGRRLCMAHRRDGEYCTQPAMRGQRVCKMHGGSKPSARRNAQMRLDRMVEPAIQRLGILVTSSESESVQLRAADSILDRTGHGRSQRVESEDAKDVLLRRLTEARERLDVGEEDDDEEE